MPPAPIDEPLAVLGAAVGASTAPLLLPHMEQLRLDDGVDLLTCGQPSSSAYVLVDGALRILLVGEGAPLILGDRYPGDWVGEVGLIDGGPATATVRTLGPCHVLRIDRPTLERLVVQEPAVASALLRHVNRMLGVRIRGSTSGIVEQVGDWVTVRRPDEVRTWVSRALSWLLGQERQT